MLYIYGRIALHLACLAYLTRLALFGRNRAITDQNLGMRLLSYQETL
jgi:hypothetical protein